MGDLVEERWLVDEMLGRLARYLRVLGCDAEYVRGLTDEAIVGKARLEDRTLVTRDAALARRTERVVLLVSTDVRGQLREVWRVRPALSRTARFDRCTLCNGPLRPIAPGADVGGGVPLHVRSATPPARVYRCVDCDHPYWEGSHTVHIRAFLSEAANAALA